MYEGLTQYNGYWTYEYCHLKHAQQFHLLSKEEEAARKLSPTKSPDKYALGLYSKLISSEILTKPGADGSEVNFQKTVIGLYGLIQAAGRSVTSRPNRG
jgi:Glucosidase II beta subunit-like protein